jgi:hypothetical protein
MAPASSPEKLWRETRGNLVVNFTDKSHFLLEPVRVATELCGAAERAAELANAKLRSLEEKVGARVVLLASRDESVEELLAACAGKVGPRGRA